MHLCSKFILLQVPFARGFLKFYTILFHYTGRCSKESLRCNKAWQNLHLEPIRGSELSISFVASHTLQWFRSCHPLEQRWQLRRVPQWRRFCWYRSQTGEGKNIQGTVIPCIVVHALVYETSRWKPMAFYIVRHVKTPKNTYFFLDFRLRRTRFLISHSDFEIFWANYPFNGQNPLENKVIFEILPSLSSYI